MLELDWGKLVVLGIVALVVIGPKELPAVLRTVGQWVTKIRRMAAEFQGQFQEAMREAELADLKKQTDSIADAARELSATKFDPIEPARREIKGAIEGNPETTPPPAPTEPTLAQPTPAAGPVVEERTAAEPIVEAAASEVSAPDPDRAAAPGGGRAP